ncbi:MAG: DUF4358 domain-containing protein [Hespellia sp.]|nr:DUF4358 domain-containing protein [Hespellia sp.]
MREQKKEKPLKKHQVVLKVVKYALALSALAYIAVLLLFTGGSSQSFEQISKGVEAVIDTDALTKMTVQDLKRYYGLNGADYEGVSLYVSKSSLSAAEVLMIRVKSVDQIAEISTAIEKRMDVRREDFEEFAPEQVNLIDSATVQIRGDFVFFTISDDAEQYKKAFTDSL